MAVKPTMLRDLCSLLQRLKWNNEMTWIMCNLSFADYRSLLWLTGSLLIKYCFASPLEYLILHQDSLIVRLFSSYPSIFFHILILFFFSQLEHLYIYTFQIIKSAQITWQTIITTVGWKNIKLQTDKSLYWPTLHGEIFSETNSWVNRLSSVKTANSVKSFNRRVNSVSTEFPEMTEWTR